MKLLLIVTTAAVALVACGHRGHKNEGAPAAKPRVTESRVTESRVTESRVTVTPALDRKVSPDKHDWVRYAADGKCSDEVAKRYDDQLKFRRLWRKEMIKRINHMKMVKQKWPDQNMKVYEESIQEIWVTIRNFVVPFDQKFGSFTCVRRSDSALLSNRILDEGIATLKEIGESFGTLPPLPPNQG